MPELVPLADGVCPDCGADVDVSRWEQLALIRHGGHGASQRTILRTCSSCGWRLIAERGEVRP